MLSGSNERLFKFTCVEWQNRTLACTEERGELTLGLDLCRASPDNSPNKVRTTRVFDTDVANGGSRLSYDYHTLHARKGGLDAGSQGRSANPIWYEYRCQHQTGLRASTARVFWAGGLNEPRGRNETTGLHESRTKKFMIKLIKQFVITRFVERKGFKSWF